MVINDLVNVKYFNCFILVLKNVSERDKQESSNKNTPSLLQARLWSSLQAHQDFLVQFHLVCYLNSFQLNFIGIFSICRW